MPKVLLGCCLFLLTVNSALSSNDEFARGRLLFENGDYRGAARQISALLNNYRLKTSEEIIAAHVTLGAAYFYLNDIAQARDHFESLLNFDRKFRLDPALYSPKVIDFFAQLRARRDHPAPSTRHEALLAANQTSFVPAAAPKIAAAQNGFAARPVDLALPPQGDHELFYRFIPFGVGQFRNGETLKGRLFMVSEIVAVLAMGVSYGLFETEQGNDGFHDADAAAFYRTLFTASLITFGAVSVVGVVDAVSTFRHAATGLESADNV